jgi:DNA-directed RNA polymerase specialized sigma24 family protein
VQAEDFQDSIRPGLVAMLPRLKRFADLLAGEKEAGKALLGRALRRMLVGQHRYQRSMAIDRFAFAEIYRQWLREQADTAAELRPEREPGRADFAQLFSTAEAEAFDPLAVEVLRSLPPLQRLTLLLTYGERYDEIDVGRVLGAAPEIVEALRLRISADLADFLMGRAGRARATAEAAS